MGRRRFRPPIILPESIAAYVRRRTGELKPGEVLFGVWEVTAEPTRLVTEDRLDRHMMRVPVRLVETGEERELVLPRRAWHNVKRRDER